MGNPRQIGQVSLPRMRSNYVGSRAHGLLERSCGEHRSERSELSNTARSAHDVRAADCVRAGEEGSSIKAGSAHDVRAADLQKEPTKRRTANGAGRCETVVSLDPTKTAAIWRTSLRAERAIERSELVGRGNQVGSRATVLDEPGSRQRWQTGRGEQACCLRAGEEGSSIKAGSAHDVRAADLQKEPTKRRTANGAGRCETVVSLDSTKTAAIWRTSLRAERAIERSELVERGNQT
jgi:hypothetical protein